MSKDKSWLEQVKGLPPHASYTHQTGQSEKDINDYWTNEKMEASLPIPKPRLKWDPNNQISQLTPDGMPIGQPFTVHPNSPMNLQQTGSVVSNPGGWPFSAVGKMFMTINGQNFSGTVFSVSGAKNVFMTAGHCVYDQASQQWATNVLVCLSYSPTYPGAQFAATNLITTCGWINSAGYQYDIGGGIVNGDMFTGRGNFGILFNQGANTGPWSAVGYPANAPYPGNTMYQSVGSYIGGDPNQPGTIGMNNNDMGGGASGGPWIVNSNWGYVNGHQSYDYDNPDTDEYSPYYGVAAYNVWVCGVSGGQQCGGCQV
ncbi:MAG: hypothetical protein JWP69_557 [Flaviaesturariibacter sp.]|nr:hypothetical protein [Flaviaesturariibacter sp.]